REAENGGPSADSGAEKAALVEITNKSIRFFCQLLLRSPEVKRKYADHPTPEFFRNLPETEMLSMLWRGDFDPASPANVAAFSATLSPPEQSCVADLLDSPLPPEPEKLAATCLQKLHRQSLEKRETEIKALLGAQGLGAEQIQALQKEKIDLTKQLHDIPRHFSD
ncbi:MAG: hypothetical protein HKN23_10180, partial [Verrucomicrobiales bacterium]|nr:hypothetical protein [Verrucomicrobiales bacterium]